jgi:hypothetical protein
MLDLCNNLNLKGFDVLSAHNTIPARRGGEKPFAKIRAGKNNGEAGF